MDEILQNAAGNTLIVGHAGVNRLILCKVLGVPIANLHSIGQDYGCLNVLDFSGKRPRVKLMNYVPLTSRPVTMISDAPDLQNAEKAGNS